MCSVAQQLFSCRLAIQKLLDLIFTLRIAFLRDNFRFGKKQWYSKWSLSLINNSSWLLEFPIDLFSLQEIGLLFSGTYGTNEIHLTHCSLLPNPSSSFPPSALSLLLLLTSWPLLSSVFCHLLEVVGIITCTVYWIFSCKTEQLMCPCCTFLKHERCLTQLTYFGSRNGVKMVEYCFNNKT